VNGCPKELVLEEFHMLRAEPPRLEPALWKYVKVFLQFMSLFGINGSF